MIPFMTRLRYPLGAPSADGAARSKIPLRIAGGAACVAICAAVAALPPGGGAPAPGHRTPAVTTAFRRALVVTSLASSGPGTLRSAMNLANASSPAAVRDHQVPGARDHHARSARCPPLPVP